MRGTGDSTVPTLFCFVIYCQKGAVGNCFKNMKKFNLFLLPFLAAFFCLTSCSSDDDGTGIEDVRSLVVGDWLYETNGEYVLYHFGSDGTGLIVDNANSIQYTKTKFVYSVNNETSIITIIPDESEIGNFLVLIINKDCINLQSLTDDRNITLNKYDGNIESEFAVNAGGYKYVDLGLSVLWATCNVGAKKVEDTGDYYAWGETEVIGDYDDYLYRHGEYPDEYYDFIGQDISGTKYDVAAVKWKGSWRMPTADEFMELIEKCDWIGENYRGMIGFRVTGPNGNSIFLPAAGGDDGKGNDPDVGEDGDYWTSTMHSEDNGTKYELARCFKFQCLSLGEDLEGTLYYATPYDDGSYRSIGKSVRPVMNR